MKIRKVCGLDVHKDTIFACITGNKISAEVKEFSTFTQGIEDLKLWLLENKVTQVAMESTSVYWIPIWNLLEDSFHLKLVNPYFIKQMPGRKSDVKDAQWISMLLNKGLLKGSYVPAKQIRELRKYERRHVHLCGRRTSVLTEIDRELTLCNIRVSSLTSTLDSKSLFKVVEKIISGKDSPKELVECIHGRSANRHKGKVQQALTGKIEEHHRILLSQSYQMLKLIDEQIIQMQSLMEQICNKYYKEQIALLKSIPGIQLLSAMTILAEIGVDLKVFLSSGHLVSWCGLRPRNDQSAGKIISQKVGKGNKYIRRILVQCAWAASRTKGTFLYDKFNQLCVRKSKKKALIAISRKLLTYIYHVLVEQKPFQEVKSIYTEKQQQNKVAYYQAKLEQAKALVINQ